MRITSRHWGLSLVLCGVLAGCDPVPEPSVPETSPEAAPDIASPQPLTPPAEADATTVSVYQCGPDLRLVAEQRGDALTLYLPERPVELAQVPAASGVKYEGDGVMLWTKGNDAILNLDDAADISCIGDSQAAVWEKAKLDGADFRAVGQEPPWVLELYPERFVLQLDYGKTRLEVPAVQPEVDAATGRSHYDSEADSHRFEITLETADCRDGMSGDAFDTRVSVVVDDHQTLNGCGRLLH